MNIYVGNLSYNTSEQDLQHLFGLYGTIDSIKIIRDKYSNQSKGFGFVVMFNKREAMAAITATNNKVFMNRTLRVNKSKPRQYPDIVKRTLPVEQQSWVRIVTTTYIW